jgi:hypothetical protein
MILKPSLSFAGPREYRWQGLEVPAMMGKRRGTAQIATALLGVCAASNRHENLLFSQLARSLCTAGQTCLHNLSSSFAGPREYRWQGLEVPAMMGKRRGTEKIATASLGVCAARNRHENLLFSQRVAETGGRGSQRQTTKDITSLGIALLTPPSFVDLQLRRSPQKMHRCRTKKVR